jgi:hypothetical protein
MYAKRRDQIELQRLIRQGYGTRLDSLPTPSESFPPGQLFMRMTVPVRTGDEDEDADGEHDRPERGGDPVRLQQRSGIDRLWGRVGRGRSGRSVGREVAEDTSPGVGILVGDAGLIESSRQ